MKRGTSDNPSNRKRSARRGPNALKLAPSSNYGSDEPWYMGVVLQQACQAMVRRTS